MSENRPDVETFKEQIKSFPGPWMIEEPEGESVRITENGFNAMIAVLLLLFPDCVNFERLSRVADTENDSEKYDEFNQAAKLCMQRHLAPNPRRRIPGLNINAGPLSLILAAFAVESELRWTESLTPKPFLVQ